MFSTTALVTGPYRAGTGVALGSVMEGAVLHVLDERLDPVPDGMVGELYLAGAGLAKGYLDRPDLTAAAFVANPFDAAGGRMYRTGDLARRSTSGELEFVGRANDLVKILGFRVELAEIEAVLTTFPGLAHVAVVAREADPGDKRLVGYVVPETGAVEEDALREHVRAALPEYMVPSAFVVIEQLPLTGNGKVDRDALPTPQFGSASAYQAPSTPAEELLCRLYAEVLRLTEVGVQDSFFDLGGHSLLAVRLLNRVRSETGVTVPISTLFNTPTPSAIAQAVDTARAA